ncbi:MAG TPA: hypothetical protein PKE27_08490 [Povalibacter sp.]|uniref:hypothetical protein n=1 Tax=Povalibacter sp. TaxID=1962978 RepID=UPI002CA6F3A0|nr:hypothetical protein [Povalibacter sp.]HMN44595.1 hypothetical protein [Povalibacter sp.]
MAFQYPLSGLGWSALFSQQLALEDLGSAHPARVAWVIDTPGMRELKVGAIDEGLRSTYTDIERLAEQCRFRDCDHRRAAGCAIVAADRGRE